MRGLTHLLLIACLCTQTQAQGQHLPAPAGGQFQDASILEDRLNALALAPSQTLLRASVAGLVQEYGERVSLESYGTSVNGVPLMILRVVPDITLDPATDESLPVALVVPAMHAACEPVTVLRTVEHLLQAGAEAPSFEVCFAIAPDPDRWLETSPERKVNLERNFPFGWDAWDLGEQAPGTAPLSEPETRGLVMWLLDEPRVMGLVRMSGDPAFTKAPAGGLESYAEHVLALPWTYADPSDATTLMSALQRIDAQRDLLAAEVVEVRRLAESLWCVDILLANGGAEVGVGPYSPLDWHVLGGEVRAGAVHGDDASGFVLLGADQAPRIPAGGHEYTLRLIIETTQKESMFVRLATPRAEPVTVAVSLVSDLPRPR